MDQETISAVMAAMGKRGGKASAKARMVKLTPEQRSEIARIAAKRSAEVRSAKAAKKRAASAKRKTRAA